MTTKDDTRPTFTLRAYKKNRPALRAMLKRLQKRFPGAKGPDVIHELLLRHEKLPPEDRL